MSAHAQPRLTPEEYLEIERAARDVKSEYFDGRMYAMSGASAPHSLITANLSGEFHQCLKKHRCSVASSDLRIRVSPGGLYTYPDLSVVCGEMQLLADSHNDTLLNPTLIVEVLSPSSEGYDRGFKFAQYRTIESLQEYVLVSQTESRVEIFRRQPGGGWLLSEYAGMDAICVFESLDCQIPLADVHAKVPLESKPSIPARPLANG